GLRSGWVTPRALRAPAVGSGGDRSGSLPRIAEQSISQPGSQKLFQRPRSQPIKAGPLWCRLRPIPAKATGSSDGVLAKAPPRRGQPAQRASPETIERGTLKLESAFAYFCRD